MQHEVVVENERTVKPKHILELGKVELGKTNKTPDSFFD